MLNKAKMFCCHQIIYQNHCSWLNAHAWKLVLFLQVLIRLRAKQTPVVIDADGLYITTKNLDLIKGYDRAILTPNKNEFQRLADQLGIDLDASKDEETLKKITVELGGPLILRKGKADQICDGTTVWSNSEAGSKRRAGGQVPSFVPFFSSLARPWTYVMKVTENLFADTQDMLIHNDRKSSLLFSIKVRWSVLRLSCTAY